MLAAASSWDSTASASFGRTAGGCCTTLVSRPTESKPTLDLATGRVQRQTSQGGKCESTSCRLQGPQAWRGARNIDPFQTIRHRPCLPDNPTRAPRNGRAVPQSLLIGSSPLVVQPTCLRDALRRQRVVPLRNHGRVVRVGLGLVPACVESTVVNQRCRWRAAAVTGRRPWLMLEPPRHRAASEL